MSFKRWFKWWLRSFSAVMFFGQKKHKSKCNEKEKNKKDVSMSAGVIL